MHSTPERVAVIGSGVAGLTAAYLLRHRYEVVLFEAEDRLGGHAHTHDIVSAHGGTIGVDSGFIVHNGRTYPQLLRLFAELGVATQDTEMSMSIRCTGCGLEYAGAKGARGVFAKPGNLARPKFLRMLTEVRRFHRHAGRVLQAAGTDEQTFGDFLTSGDYSRYFIEHFALPLVSTVWSADRVDTLLYPARYLFEFLRNHGMLAVTGSPRWRTVVGGSREYVQLAAKQLTAVNLATPVRSVRRSGTGERAVRVRDEGDTVHDVDRVVLATHADQALRLLEDPTADESRLLGAFRYSRNDAWLHTDSSTLPSRAGVRAGWNYTADACGGGSHEGSRDGAARVSYDLNRLMRLDEPADYVVSLNPAQPPRQDSVITRMTYEHPIYTTESLAAQRELAALNDGRSAYAGAYHGWGFHEDGCAAGVRAAASLGVHW